MKVELAPIDTIKPFPNNPRKLSETAIEKVAQSIQEFGFRQPIVIDKDRIIVVGHTRYRASKKLGYKKVPITIAENLTKEQINAYRIADNRTNEEAKWDEELLKMELKELDYKDFDLKMTGFDDKQINDLLFEEKQGLTDDDAVPDTPEEPISKLGDIWQLGKHRLLCGDATKEEDVNKLMDGAKADMVFTDPPYGINLNTDYSTMGNKSKKHRPIYGDNKKFNYFDLGCDEQFWFGGDYYVDTLPKNGSWFVWDKYPTDQNDKRFGSAFEMIWSKQKHKRSIYRIMSLNVGHYKREIIQHPTQKPSDLLSKIIDKYSKKNNIILDLFGGSGSTLIGCEKTDRICYMMELEPKYCDVIVKRWEQWSGEKATK